MDDNQLSPSSLRSADESFDRASENQQSDLRTELRNLRNELKGVGRFLEEPTNESAKFESIDATNGLSDKIEEIVKNHPRDVREINRTRSLRKAALESSREDENLLASAVEPDLESTVVLDKKPPKGVLATQIRSNARRTDEIL